MNNHTLKLENQAFRGTKGVSENNRSDGFKPAFLNQKTGRVELARFGNGTPAPVHLIDGLPEEWTATRGKDGTAVSLLSEIVAGFVREGVFYSREEAATH